MPSGMRSDVSGTNLFMPFFGQPFGHTVLTGLALTTTMLLLPNPLLESVSPTTANLTHAPLTIASHIEQPEHPDTPLKQVGYHLNTAYNAATRATRIEVRLDDRQVVLYRGDAPVKRYPVGIGRPGWETPTGAFNVKQKQRNPNWISPFTNETIPARDPRNPLQGYWIGFWTDGSNWIGFHGTSDPNTIGKAQSHGCIQMYRSDLAELFSLVDLGTAIQVVR